ncbi:MAG TPA: DUF4038 domain-containing protein [Polyangia bacterium]|nr:DUF4038 domain-containing protein [Polyangia bacterium]
MISPSLKVALGTALALIFVALGMLFWRSGSARAYAPASYDAGARKLQLPLRLSADRRRLLDGAGAPFLIHGEAAWSLIAQLRDDEVAAYLADRRARGINLVMVNLVEHKYADHAPRDAAGQAPFLAPGDFARPNDAYFRRADQTIRRAGEAGMVVLLCPAYLGYDGEDEGWYREMRAAGPAVMRGYGRYVGQRYASFDNVVWLEGGDFTPPAEGVALVNAVAAGIREKDPRHLHAAHWGPETSGADLPAAVDAGWLDLNTTYTYRAVYQKSAADDRHPTHLPHVLIESAYEDAPDHPSTPRAMRAQAYAALLTGATGQIYGHNEVWKFSPAWQKSLASPGAISMTHLRALFESRNWSELAFDRENQILVGGQGDNGSLDYALLAATRDGRLAITYLPRVRDVVIDLARLNGPLRARWYDPTTGRFSDAAPGVLPAQGRQKFRPARKNAVGDPDWVLVLEGAG